MVAFTAKRLPSTKTIAEILRDERLKMDLTVDQVAERARVSQLHLINLENGCYELLPGEVYAKQFIKNLANFYRLSSTALISMYNKERGFHQLLLEPLALTKKKYYLGWLSSLLIKKIIISAICLLLLFYLTWEVTAIYRPPKLIVQAPIDQITTNEPFIDIVGATAKGAFLTINEQTVIINSDGSFKQTVNLADGLNKFIITAKREHSRLAIKTLTILKTTAN
jgi:transcriptional regulator with XRE-family HTH domain